MKGKYFFAMLSVLPFVLPAQNDLCDNAVVLNPAVFCIQTQVNMGGATIENPPTACAPNASQDVWYKFVANGTSMKVEISGATGINNGFEILAGSCTGSLVACIITNSAGSAGFTGNNYISGNTYFIRVFNAGTTPITTPFNVCVYNPNMGIDENQGEDITLFPNPSAAFLNIDFGQSDVHYDYQVLNQLGQTVSAGTLKNGKIDIRNLQSGVYYLQMIDRDQNKSFTKKFLKQ